MKLTKIIRYMDKDYNTLDFVPVKNVPGFTHKVIVNDVRVGWLSSDFKPNEKAAVYFFSLQSKPEVA